MRRWLIGFLIIIGLSACNTSIENCSCKQVDIYYMSSGILTPIRMHAEDLKHGEPYIFKDQSQIDTILGQIKSFTPFAKDGDGWAVDNRIVLELHCTDKKNITVESNAGLAKIHDQFYEPDERYKDFILELILDQKARSQENNQSRTTNNSQKK